MLSTFTSDVALPVQTYNILKVARHLYQWSADSGFFDFYERALFNGLIGNQNRLAPYGPGRHSTGKPLNPIIS